MIACGPCSAMTAVNRSWIRSSASSHEIRANLPSPFAPTRRSGVRNRAGPWTNSGYDAGTFAHSTPSVYGLARVPRMSTIVSFSTVTAMLQVSGQSSGQTLAFVTRAVMVPISVAILSAADAPVSSVRRMDEVRSGHLVGDGDHLRAITPAMTSGLEDRFQTLHEIFKAAHQNLAPGPWDYLTGATETETTLRRNRMAIDSVAFRPRVLRDVSRVDTSTTFLGRRMRIPVMQAPIGSIESFTPAGGAAAARGCAASGVLLMLSSVCNPGLGATAAAAPDGFRIFQLYVRGDDTFVDDHVKRARDNGYAAFALTVDTAHYSRRERDLAKRFVKPWRQRATGREF